MKRIGEIIAIQGPEITIEFYEAKPVPSAVEGPEHSIGSVISTETGNKRGIIHSIQSVLIEEGKTGQAFGNKESTDEQVKKDFPHLKNSLRLLAKAYMWHEDNAPLLLNQGIYGGIPLTELLSKREYWQTVRLLPLASLERHIAWLRSQESDFSDDTYLEKLSTVNRPLAWEIFLQQGK